MLLYQTQIKGDMYYFRYFGWFSRVKIIAYKKVDKNIAGIQINGVLKKIGSKWYNAAVLNPMQPSLFIATLLNPLHNGKVEVLKHAFEFIKEKNFDFSPLKDVDTKEKWEETMLQIVPKELIEEFCEKMDGYIEHSNSTAYQIIFFTAVEETIFKLFRPNEKSYLDVARKVVKDQRPHFEFETDYPKFRDSHYPQKMGTMFMDGIKDIEPLFPFLDVKEEDLLMVFDVAYDDGRFEEDILDELRRNNHI